MEVDLLYNSTPTTSKFMKSDAFFRLIAGPVGSGKTVACCVEIPRRCIEMTPGSDGIRRSRWVVVRNTSSQLNDTTIKTFLEWVKPGVLGHWKVSDKTFHLKFGDVEAEVLFRALDSPDDVKRVLSLEVTGVYLNESIMIHKDIVEALQGRIGRYPRKQDVPHYWHGMIADTNMPEEDSYWHKVMEGLPVSNGDPESIMPCDVFIQPSGLSAEAENTENLVDGYYERLSKGRTKGWVDVFVHGQYGVSKEGIAVYEDSFQQEFHVSKTPIPIDPDKPILIGQDYGRDHAAVIKQVMDDGRVHTLREVVTFKIGIDTFIKYHLKPQLQRDFPENEILVIGDPSGVKRNDTDDGTCFRSMKKAGFVAKPARTNDPTVRIDATEKLLIEFPMGKPMYLIDPSCKWLIQGFKSKYYYKRERGTDGEIKDKPAKNAWSHTMEANQYADLHITGGRYGLLYSQAAQNNGIVITNEQSAYHIR